MSSTFNVGDIFTTWNAKGYFKVLKINKNQSYNGITLRDSLDCVLVAHPDGSIPKSKKAND